MNGKITKFYFYESVGSGRITIPVSISKSLSWNHLDDITIKYEVINGNKGLFLYKKTKS